ncbi:MAG: SAVED domain-containing protein [Acidobacteria bacterium]|nr:SAVED domain-containing protein [Acidobacteriota bacterium]
MRYQDFEIRIQAAPRGKLKAEAESPCGSGASTFKLPFPKNEIQGVAEQFDLLLSPKKDQTPQLTLERIGQALYESLFAGPVGQRFHESRARLEGGGQDEGLRIRLNFDLGDPGILLLAGLPWELVRDGERADFLCRLRNTSIVRYVPVGRPPLPPFTGPLKVLVAMAGPSDLDHLDLEEEWKKIWAALGQNPTISVSAIQQPSLADLRKKLLEDTWHVLHFIGHGGFDDQSGNGTVCFVAPGGKEEPVTGAMLGEHLKSFPNLRLVFLNACDTARLPRRQGQDAHRATATALVQAGVPAVIAMQTPIYDRPAIELSAAFYERLAAHDPVDAALAEGRLAILRAQSPDWATPALFTRIRDGNILGEEGRNGAARGSRPPSTARETDPIRLGIRTFSDTGGVFVWGGEMDQECDEILDLRPFFTGKGNRYIKESCLWQTEVVPRLRKFLTQAGASRRPLHLNLAAHSSIAFAAGYVLNVKSGLDVTLRQRVRSDNPVQEWRVAPVAPDQETLFRKQRDVPGDASANDVAVALSITRPVLVDVRHYLETSKLAVRRTLPVELATGPSWNGVRDGLHALRLAEVLASKLAARTVQERYGVLHLFASAPNALLFFLGQLSHGLGRIQLYEHDFESGLPGAYIPSILLPPAEEKPAGA